ncbi:hypothetical protein ACHWQZ_G017250 [Mnemiopsis leidyi]
MASLAMCDTYTVKDLGCWVDVESPRAINSLEGDGEVVHILGSGDYWFRTDAYNKCLEAALYLGYHVFALQAGGWCASSPTAESTYNQYGESSSCEADGEGGVYANQVYKIQNIVSFTVIENLGCWKDQTDRAIELLEGKYGLTDNYRERVQAYRKCRDVTINLGYRVFALQYGGHCCSSPTAEDTYNRYGESSGCEADGKGGVYANQVYKIHYNVEIMFMLLTLSSFACLAVSFCESYTVEKLGCWTDQDPRAIQGLEGNSEVEHILESNTIGYLNRTGSYDKCLQSALHLGYEVFALQNSGWCASSPIAEITYKKYGQSSNCLGDGEGGPLANQVYKIVHDLRWIENLGCWKDIGDNRSIGFLEAQDKSLLDNYLERTNAFKKCLDAAERFGYHVFALQDGGQCASSPIAENTYKKHGESSSCAADGEGGAYANQVYKIHYKDASFTVIENLGCWKDQTDRAIELLEGKYGLTDYYRERVQAFRKCRDVAVILGYHVFALQDGGQCACSPTAENTYKKYGESSSCAANGKGGYFANQVYKIPYNTRIMLIFLSLTSFACISVSVCESYTVEQLGCWTDQDPRAIQGLEGNSEVEHILESNTIGYLNRTGSYDRCLKSALHLGYEVFALQNSGWCASSPIAEITYKKYGQSSNCLGDGKGGPFANQVYKIVHDNYSVEYLGCWNDKDSDKAIPTLEQQYDSLSGYYKTRTTAYKKCFEATLEFGYRVFALQDGGQCRSSPIAAHTYVRHGAAVVECAADGKGGLGQNQVYRIDYNSDFLVVNLGCWHDQVQDRAIETLEGVDYLTDDYKNREQAYKKCRDVARNLGYHVFALQAGGWCASSPIAENTYKKHGQSSSCGADGKGGINANQVYKILNLGKSDTNHVEFKGMYCLNPYTLVQENGTIHCDGWSNTDKETCIQKTRLYPSIAKKTLFYPSIAKKTLFYPSIAKKTLFYPSIAKKTLFYPSIAKKTLFYPSIAKKTLFYPSIAKKTLFYPSIAKKTLFYPCIAKKTLFYPSIAKKILFYPSIAKKTLFYPSIAKKTLFYPSIAKKTLFYPSIAKKTLVYPSIAKKTLVYPSIAKKTLFYPSIAKKTLFYPSIAKKTLLYPSIAKKNSVLSHYCKENSVLSQYCKENSVLSQYCKENSQVFSQYCIENSVLSQYCKENPVLSQYCKENSVLSQYCKENSVLSQYCIENSVLSQYCKENPVLSQYCKENSVLSQYCKENSVLSQYCKENSVLSQYRKENSVLSQYCKENSVLSQYCKENSVLSQYCKENSVLSQYRKENSVLSQYCKKNSKLSQYCKENSVLSQYCKENSVLSQYCKENSVLSQYCKENSVLSQYCKENSVLSQYRKENSVLSQYCKENSVLSQYCKENSVLSQYCKENSVLSQYRKENSVLSQYCKKNSKLSQYCKENSVLSQYCKENSVLSQYCKENSVLSQYCKENSQVLSQYCIENSVLSQYCKENPVLSQYCKENSVLSQYCKENSVLSQYCIENSVLSQYCKENPVLSQYCKENSVLSQYCKENSVLSQYCKENSVLSQYRKENSVLSQYCKENSVLSQYCKENSVLSQYCKENSVLSQYRKENSVLSQYCKENSVLSQYCKENSVLSQYCKENSVLSQYRKENSVLSQYCKKNSKLSQYCKENSVLSQYRKENSVLSQYCKENSVLSQYCKENSVLSQYCKENSVLSQYRKENSVLSQYCKKNSKLSQYCKENSVLSQYCKENSVLSQYCKENSVLSQYCKENRTPNAYKCPPPRGGCRYAIWYWYNSDSVPWCHLEGDDCRIASSEHGTIIDTKLGLSAFMYLQDEGLTILISRIFNDRRACVPSRQSIKYC